MLANAQVSIDTSKTPGPLNCGPCPVAPDRSFVAVTHTRFQESGHPNLPGGTCTWSGTKVQIDRCPAHPPSCEPTRTLVDLKILGSKSFPFEAFCRETAFAPEKNPWPDMVNKDLGPLQSGQLVRLPIPQWFVGDFILTLEGIDWLYLKNDSSRGPIIAGAVPKELPTGTYEGRARGQNPTGGASDTFRVRVVGR